MRVVLSTAVLVGQAPAPVPGQNLTFRGTASLVALNVSVFDSLKQFGQLARHNAEIRPQAITVLADGDDTSSMVTFDDVLALARESGVSLYMVGLQPQYALQRLGPDAKHRFLSESDHALKTLARETGAQAFFPSEVGQLKGIYASIAMELANQYSIGKEPANIGADGGFRRINVRLVSHPELVLRTRPGYTADAHGAGH